MTRTLTAVEHRWTEDDGRLALAHRCNARCEGCGGHWNGQAAHRQRRSHGGTWNPINLVALCGSGTTGCHGLQHARPALFQGLGWEIGPLDDPALIPVWILTPHRVGPGWHLLAIELDTDGIRQHVVRPVEPRWVP